jgi:hypothetical protein
MKKIFQFLKESIMLYVPVFLVILFFSFITHSSPNWNILNYAFDMSIHWVSLIFIITVVSIRLFVKNKK